MAQPFNHGFTESPKDIDGMRGFANCMTAILNHIKEETEGGYKKDTISVPALIDRIEKTNDELRTLMLGAAVKALQEPIQQSHQTT